jgi:uncharacterized DUF497 family protein
MKISWNEEKAISLLQTRGVDFHAVRAEILADRFIGPEANPGHPARQRINVSLHGYPHIVPLVVDADGNQFLKTIFPSRKTKKEGRI